MSDPVLEYLKSVKQDLREIKQDMSGMLQKHDERIDDLETKFAEQRGAVKIAGVFFTAISAVVSFAVSFVRG